MDKMCDIYIYIYNGVFFDLKKEGNPVMWYNMDEPLEHCSK